MFARVRILAITLALIGIAVAAGWAVRRAFEEPVDMKACNTLKAGMTQPQVRAILGPPRDSHPADGDWRYRRPFVLGYVTILFDSEGRVVNYFYERV